MKLLIAGSRSIINYNIIEKYVNKCRQSLIPEHIITHIISGHAIGVDQLGEMYAKEHNIPIVIFKPDWGKFGKPAGFIRNKEMVNYCDIGIIFWDGKSSGTKHTLNLLRDRGKLFNLVICP